MAARQPDDKCKEVFALLSEYLDLEIPPERCEQIAAHIEGCAPCVEFLDSLRKTIELCREHRPAELPRPVRDEAKEQLREAYAKMLARRAASE
jgi:anti-sigma factor RsiW